jgi:hypothetical protein
MKMGYARLAGISLPTMHEVAMALDDETLRKMAKHFPNYYKNILGNIPYEEYLEAELELGWAYGALIANQIWNIVQADELDVVAVDKLVKEYDGLEAKIWGTANFDLNVLVRNLEYRAKLKRNQT